MNKTWRRTVLPAVLALTASLMAACGTSPASGDKATLQIWDFSGEQVDFHKKVGAEFTKEHPDIQIQWRSITQDEYTKTLPLAFQSHQAPDIFYWSDGGSMNMAQLLAQKWIAPLDPSGKPPAEFTNRWPKGSFIDGINMSGGKTYGFPFSENLYWGAGYMYLNNQVFAQAGLDPKKPPKTWTELKNACAKVVEKTDAECIASPSKGTDIQRIWYALAAGSMTDMFFDYKNGKFSLDDPRLLRTFSYIQDLNRAGYLAPGTNDKNFSRQQFAASQAAIYLDGTWMPSVWQAQGFASDKYTVAAHPNPDGGATGSLSREQDGNKYWVSSQTKHADAAWTFLDWMTQPNGTFVKEYFKAGLGTLAFTDNKKYVTDPAIKQIMKIAEKPGFRATVPVPVLKCPDVAKSTAYLDAISKRPNWEFEAMGEALADGKDLAPLARDLVTQRQQILTSTLDAEAAKGLKVSIDCYTFKDWNYKDDYGLDRYRG
jgi:ABC-type glycerol-3-phosphate transport system substrate-binding protein